MIFTRNKARIALCVGAIMFSSAAAHAVSCAGVEGRVNVRTNALQASVTAAITASQASLIAQETLERQRLLSAVKVLTMQIGTSSQQEIVANQASSKALAQTLVEQSIADQTRNAVRDYGTTGYNACGLVAKGAEVAKAVQQAKGSRKSITDEIAKRHSIKTRDDYNTASSSWFELAQKGDDVSSEALFRGDDAAAQKYISLVMGPPRAPKAVGGAAGNIDRAVALRDIARQSVTGYVLAEVAATKKVEDALKSMTSEWVGDDGGTAWFAKQAAAPGRAVLLDSVRIEAANVAMKANAVKRYMLEEFALATFSLAYSDRLAEK